MIKTPFILFIFILFCFHSFGQQKKLDKEFSDIYFLSSDYIFEGTVLSSRTYKAGDYYSAFLVRIHKVFRGNLKAGTVEILAPYLGEIYDSVTKETKSVVYSHYNGLDERSIGETYLFSTMKSPLPDPPRNSIPTNPVKMYINGSFKYNLNYNPIDSGYVIWECLGNLGCKKYKELPPFYDFILSQPNTKLIKLDNKEFEKDKPPVRIKKTQPADTSGHYERKERFDKFMRISFEKVFMRRVVQPAEYIFEGTIIRQKKFWGKEQHTLYESNIIQIHKVFRGNLSHGTIEIITKGYSEVYDSLNKETIVIESSHGGGSLLLNRTYTLFCTQSIVTSPKLFRVTNKQTLSVLQVLLYDLKYSSKRALTELSIEGQAIKSFESTQSLYDYILSLPNTKLIKMDE